MLKECIPCNAISLHFLHHLKPIHYHLVSDFIIAVNNLLLSFAGFLRSVLLSNTSNCCYHFVSLLPENRIL
jgi:hypothetical protein